MEEETGSQGERLSQFILSEIGKGGPIPFSQFMEWCLFHPEYGYYRSERAKIGRDGDYYTSPCVHPLFGGMIAKQLSQMAEQMGGSTFDVVESGGGRGFLCEDVLQWTKKNSPVFYQRLHYHLIETAPPFLKEQKERLREYKKEGKIFWIESEAFEKGKIQMEGCFLTNELLDAFPVHQVVVDHGNLKEVYVTQENSQLKEHYASHRRAGTLLCYTRHRTSDNPYERIGEQDITSHVNFTSLILKGEELGLRLTGLVPQYQFLMAWGLLQEMESMEKEMSEMDGFQFRLSLKHLIEPEMGMGEVFKVLIQHKGIIEPQLNGLREFRSIFWSKIPPSLMEGTKALGSDGRDL